jgi:chorismate mutase/prephenate dehydratase
VERRAADFAVVPFESASEGPEAATLLALRSSDLKIVAVHDLDVRLSLVSKKGDLRQIERVYATARDRAAGRVGLGLVPSATVLDAASPAEACRLAAEDPGAAAIAPDTVATDLGLEIVAPASADGVRARFCVISARPASRTGTDATALLFTVGDEPGALFSVLKHFAERGVNLRKIHSRPAEPGGWDYLFFIEVSGHVTDRPVVTALEGVKRQTKTLKILGSYPV